MISLTDIKKDFVSAGGLVTPVLKGISFDIKAGEYVAVMGPSGSGKSTLLNIVGCLERPTSGRYRLNEEEAHGLADAKLARFRRDTIGFVFQGFHLLPRRTALQNVMLPMQYARKEKNICEHARELLDRVGLADHAHKYPMQMSGGMQQRVALARSLANRPVLVLADEPTGNLDSATSEDILKVFRELNEREHITILMVTHNEAVASHTGRLIVCVDGVIKHDGNVQKGLSISK
jgi:ABC-type lipoprotein export system ATPase subunit